jgi:hypothetical protein
MNINRKIKNFRMNNKLIKKIKQIKNKNIQAKHNGYKYLYLISTKIKPLIILTKANKKN